MKTLVTGATGFLGAALCARLRAQGAAVTALSSRDAELTKPGSLDRFTQKYDRVFHLAAWTQAGDFCLRHPGEQWIINQQINTNALAWWRERQPQAKLVSIGTSCAYPPGSALREEDYLRGVLEPSLLTYAMTKRMLYVGLLAFEKQFGLRHLCAVPTTLYGPGYRVEDGRQLHFIFDLIRKIIRGKERGEPVVLWGDGRQKRELMFLDDFVAALLALDAKAENELVNVSSGEEHTIRHFAETICAAVGYPAKKIRYDTTRYVGAKAKSLSAKKLRKILGPLKLTPLETGIEKTVRWFYDSKSF